MEDRIQTLISKLEKEIPKVIREVIEKEIIPLMTEKNMVPEQAIRTYVNSRIPTENQVLFRIALIRCGFSKLVEPINK